MTELTYREVNGVLLPNIELKNKEQKPLGKYGKMRRTFLQEHRQITFSKMVMREQLFPHLREIDEIATRRVRELTEQYLQETPAPDKELHTAEWIDHMNALTAKAEEVVIQEIINK